LLTVAGASALDRRVAVIDTGGFDMTKVLSWGGGVARWRGGAVAQA
jgi:hypothetical protein